MSCQEYQIQQDKKSIPIQRHRLRLMASHLLGYHKR